MRAGREETPVQKMKKNCLHSVRNCYIISLALRKTSTKQIDARLAQLAEHLTLNQGVQGSNP